MTKGIEGKIRNLEQRMKREFNADAVFPAGVPAELRLSLLREAMEEVRVARQDPEYEEMRKLFGEMHTTVDFCSGWCPGCEILE